MPYLLAINTGSSSVKFSVFDVGEDIVSVMVGQGIGIGVGGHVDAVNAVFGRVEQAGYLADISFIAHRIVHGGPDFGRPVRLTRSIEAELEKLVPMAPLHMRIGLDGIAIARARLPQAAQFACFDTGFHGDMPKLAQYTGLPLDMDGGLLRRYGFHGLSCEYVLFELARRYGLETAKGRIIVAHLGSGASMTAIHKGGSVDTTMGFSPLSGLPMATRSGNVEPGLLFYLLNEAGWDAGELHDLLENRSGLLGLSGQSGDMQVLTAPDANAACKFAVASFCYQARKHLGALIAALGGLDRLIFTGGIGENSAVIRANICTPLAENFGLRIDGSKNSKSSPDISASNSPIKIDIIKTDEAYIMASHIVALTSNA